MRGGLASLRLAMPLALVGSVTSILGAQIGLALPTHAVEAALGLQFAQKQITVKAGERVSLTFTNPDVVPHNWVLAKPGSLAALGDAANKLITDPAALARHYIPDSPDVLAYTDMANPATSVTIHFTAPATKGDYPYLCTFPGQIGRAHV